MIARDKLFQRAKVMGWWPRTIYVLGWAVLILLMVAAVTGCTTTGTLLDQLAKEGEFDTIQVITRQGDRVKVKYKDDEWFVEEVE